MSFQNCTLDDQSGDPRLTFSPDGAGEWLSVNHDGRAAPGIDMERAHNGTWHDSTFFNPGDMPKVMSFTFKGTAVYVYNILIPPGYAAISSTNLTFSLDGQEVGNFYRTPTSISETMYDVLVYYTTGLANESHTLQMVAEGSGASLILFDYIVYTAYVPQSSTSIPLTCTVPADLSTPPPCSSWTHSPVGPTSAAGISSHTMIIASVAGSAAGCLVIVVAGLIVAVLLLRRNHKRRELQFQRQMEIALNFTSMARGNAPVVDPHVHQPQETRLPSTLHSSTHMRPTSARLNLNGVLQSITAVTAAEATLEISTATPPTSTRPTPGDANILTTEPSLRSLRVTPVWDLQMGTRGASYDNDSPPPSYCTAQGSGGDIGAVGVREG